MAAREDPFWAYYVAFPDEREIRDTIDILVAFFGQPQVFVRYLRFKPAAPCPCEFHFDYTRAVAETASDPSLNRTFRLLKTDPERFFSVLNYSVHYAIQSNLPHTDFTARPIKVLLDSYEQSIQLREVRSALIGQFVSVVGSVVKISTKRPLILEMAFKCGQCQHVFMSPFLDGRYTLPKQCTKCGNTKAFWPDRNNVKCVNSKRIRIQEYTNEQSSRVPLTLNCVAKGIDVSGLVVGDTASVMGVIRAETAENAKGKNSGLYGLYIDIKSVAKSNNEAGEVDDFTAEEELEFQRLAKEPGIFPVLINSFCEAIYGHEKVKAGLILALLGGSEGNERGAIHVLVVGDPGLGKTQMLRSAVDLSSRGIYVSSSASKAGLTVNISREHGEENLRAGALVLADEGICAIDEFDKLAEQQALLEAMEQQSVTVFKSGVFCTLKARVTVLAAANPHDGHYNRAKSLCDNIKINNALLSRFDLMFLLLDTPDQELSKHIVRVHSRKRNFEDAFATCPSTVLSSAFSDMPYNDPKPGRDETFSAYFKRIARDGISSLPRNKLKRYLAYAKKACHPRLSYQAVQVIKAFYVALRKESSGLGVAVITRQLQSLKRLSEARAKAELREEVTESDAIEVIKLYQETLFDTQVKDFAVTSNVKRFRGDKPIGEMSLPKQQLAFEDRIREMKEEKGTNLFEFQELVAVSKAMGLKVGDFNQFIERLNVQSVLLKKGGGVYQYLSG